MKPMDVEISDKAWVLIHSLLPVDVNNTELREHLGALKGVFQNDREGGGDARSADVEKVVLRLKAASERFAAALEEVIQSSDPSSMEAEFCVEHTRHVTIKLTDLLTRVQAFGESCGDLSVRFKDGGGPNTKAYRDYFLYRLDQLLDEVKPRPIDDTRAQIALCLMREAGETKLPAQGSVVAYLRRIRGATKPQGK